MTSSNVVPNGLSPPVARHPLVFTALTTVGLTGMMVGYVGRKVRRGGVVMTYDLFRMF